MTSRKMKKKHTNLVRKKLLQKVGDAKKLRRFVSSKNGLVIKIRNRKEIERR